MPGKPSPKHDKGKSPRVGQNPVELNQATLELVNKILTTAGEISKLEGLDRDIKDHALKYCLCSVLENFKFDEGRSQQPLSDNFRTKLFGKDQHNPANTARNNLVHKQQSPVSLYSLHCAVTGLYRQALDYEAGTDKTLSKYNQEIVALPSIQNMQYLMGLGDTTDKVYQPLKTLSDSNGKKDEGGILENDPNLRKAYLYATKNVVREFYEIRSRDEALNRSILDQLIEAHKQDKSVDITLPDTKVRNEICHGINPDKTITMGQAIEHLGKISKTVSVLRGNMEKTKQYQEPISKASDLNPRDQEQLINSKDSISSNAPSKQPSATVGKSFVPDNQVQEHK